MSYVEPRAHTQESQSEAVLADQGGLSVSPLGLSTCHICTRWRGGHLFALNGESEIDSSEDRPESRRNVITEFSAASRRRLMRQVARLNLEAMGLPSFMTLTYPAEFPTDGPTTKAHLHAFEQALNRRFGSPYVIWKLEFQRRGAPHYHLLVWGITPGRREREWLSQTWYRIVGSFDPKHLRAGTQWNLCYSWRQVASYTSKYLGKVQGIPAGFVQVGRLWGVWNDDKRVEQAISEEVPTGGFHLMRRVMRRWANRGKRKRFHVRSCSRWHGLTVLMSEETSKRLMAWAWGNAWQSFESKGNDCKGGRHVSGRVR